MGDTKVEVEKKKEQEEEKKKDKALEQEKEQESEQVEEQEEEQVEKEEEQAEAEQEGVQKPDSQTPEWETALEERRKSAHKVYHQIKKIKEKVPTIEKKEDLENYRKSLPEKANMMLKLQTEADVFHQAMQDDGKATKSHKKAGKTHYKKCKRHMRKYMEIGENLDKMIGRRIKTLTLKESLTQRAGKNKPLMKLLAKVSSIDGIKKAAPEEFDAYEAFSESYDAVGEYVTDPLSDIKDLEDAAGDFKDSKTDKDSFYDPWAKGSDEDPETITEAIGEGFDIAMTIKSWFDSAKKGLDLIKEAVKISDDLADMSNSNKAEAALSFFTNAGDFIMGVIGNIADAVKAVPGVGAILGLLKNAWTFLSKGIKIFLAQKRMEGLRDQKRALKAKMKKRKEKARKKGQNLYAFLDDDGKIDKNKMGDRETRGLDGKSGEAVRGKIKRNEKKENPAQEALYRMGKEEEDIQRYDEMKEAIYKNKNVRKSAIVALVHEGVDMVGNICAFFPGYGALAQAGLKVANTTVKLGTKLGTKIREAWREKTGHKRSKSNKAKFRKKYAEHIYDHMKDISPKVNTDGTFKMDDLDDAGVKSLESSYTYVDSMLGGMNAYMPDLIRSTSKPELIRQMAKAFANS